MGGVEAVLFDFGGVFTRSPFAAVQEGGDELGLARLEHAQPQSRRREIHQREMPVGPSAKYATAITTSITVATSA